MIKIPKSLDELKQMVSEANVNEMIGKVKSGINSATEVVKNAASSAGSKIEDAEGQVLLTRLKELNKEQATCVNTLESYIQGLQKQLQQLQAQVQKIELEHAPAPVATDANKTEAVASSTEAEHKTSESEK